MNPVLVEAVGLAAVGNTAWVSLLITILLLNAPDGRTTAAAYVGAYALSYAVIGLVAVHAGRAAGLSETLVGPVLNIALGLVLLALAFRAWRATDSPPDRLLTGLAKTRPPRALALGVLMTVINIKNLGIFLAAIAPIATSQMPGVSRSLAVVPVVAMFCALHFVPLALSLLAPDRSATLLARLQGAVEKHGRSVARTLLPILGCAFLLRGLVALWG